MSRDESTFNLKQVCDQRNLEDSFIGILVGRLGGRLSWVLRCFRTEPFLTSLLFVLSWLLIVDSQNIYLCVSLSPFIWIFHEMRKSACFVVLLRCVSMLDQPDVKRAAGHDLRLLPSSLVCLPLFLPAASFQMGDVTQCCPSPPSAS